MTPDPASRPELHDPWKPTDEAPLLGLKSALLLGVGALAMLLSLAT